MAEGTDYGWMMGYAPPPQDVVAQMEGAAWSENQFAPGGQYSWVMSDPRYSEYLAQGYSPQVMDTGQIALIKGDMQDGGISRLMLGPDGSVTPTFEERKSTGDKVSAALESAAPYLLAMAAIATGGVALGAYAGSGSAAGAGALTTEGILGASSPYYSTGSLGGFGSGVAYGAPTTLEGALSAMTGGGVAASTAGMTLPAGFEEAGISMEDLLPGGTNAPAGSTTGAATASGVPLGQVGNAWQQAAAAAAQQGAGSSGGTRTPGLPQTGQQSGVGNLTGNGTLDSILRMLAGVQGAQQQQSLADKLLARTAEATPNRMFYEDALKTSYQNPGAYLQGPDVQGALTTTLQKLQSSDAAGGRLANDTGRQNYLNNYLIQNLEKYRSGLAGIVSQQANTFTGANGLYKDAATLDSSVNNNILQGILGALGTQTGNGTVGQNISSQIGDWWSRLPSSTPTSTPSTGTMGIEPWLSGGSSLPYVA